MTLSKIIAEIRQFSQKGLKRNTVLAVAQALVGVLAIFLSFRLLIKYQGIEAIGLWSVTVGIVSFARLADVSGGAALARFVSIAEPGDESRYIDTILLFTIVFYTLICAAAWLPFSHVLAGIVDPNFIAESQKLVPLALISLILMVSGGSQSSALDGYHRADLRAIIAIFGFIVFLILSVVLIPKHGVIGLAWAQIAQFSFVFIAARVTLCRIMTRLSIFPFRWSLPAFKETVSYGLRLQLNSVASIIFDPLMKLVITQFSGLAALGIYELAYRMVTQARSLILAAVMPMVPEFAKAHKDNARDSVELIYRANQHVNKFNLAALGAIILLAPIASYVLLAEFSLLFHIYVIGLAAAFFINIIVIPVYLYAQSISLLRWNILGQFCIAIVSTLSGIIIAKFLNPAYTPLGVVIGVIIGSILTFYANSKHLNIDIRRILPHRRVLSFLVLILCIGALYYYVLQKVFGI